MIYHIAIKRNEVYTSLCCNMNKPYVKWKKWDTKEDTLHDFSDVKFPEEVNPSRQKVDSWLLRAGQRGDGKGLLSMYSSFIGK